MHRAVVKEGLAQRDVAERGCAEAAAIVLALQEIRAQRTTQAEVEIGSLLTITSG